MGAVCVAWGEEDADGAPRFAAKVFEPVEALGDADKGLRAFLTAAETQKAAARGPDRHWAPVHELGELTSRAFFVTDYYPRSAERLIKGRVKLTAGALYRIADAVVRGLRELGAAAGRGHGNLKPSNVLIAGTTSRIDHARVVLSDPAAGGASGPDAEARDLRALGELIYELVVHRPFNRRTGWPVPPSAEWDSLGRTADAWRELCNRLVHPIDDPEEKRLDAVAAALSGLSPARERRRLLLREAALALPLALVVAAAVMAALNHSAIVRLRAAEGSGFADVAKSVLDDRDRLDHYRADPILRQLVGAVGAARAVEQERGWLYGLSLSRLREARRAEADLRTAARALSPQKWPPAARAEQFQQKFAVLGWRQPQRYLGGLLKAISVRPVGMIAVDGIDGLLAVGPRLDCEAEAVAEAAQRNVNEVLRQWDRSGDPQLARFAATVRAALPPADLGLCLGAEGWSQLDGLRSAADLAARLKDAVAQAGARGWPEKVDRGRFADEVERKFGSQVSDWDVQDWLARVDDYLLVRADDSDAWAERPRGIVKARIDGLDAELRDISHWAAGKAGFEEARKPIAAEIGALGQKPFVAKDVLSTSPAFANAVNAIETDLARLRKDFVDRPEDWIARVPETILAPPPISLKWREWVRGLNEQLPAIRGNADLFHRLQDTTEGWRRYLVDLDRDFPPVPRELTGGFAEQAVGKRERAIAAMIGPFHPGPSVPPPDVRPAAAAFLRDCLPLVESQKQADALRAKLEEREREHDDEGAILAAGRLRALTPGDQGVQGRYAQIAARLEAARRRASVLDRFKHAEDQGNAADATSALEDLKRLNPEDPEAEGLKKRLITLLEEGRQAKLARLLAAARAEPDPVKALTLTGDALQLDANNSEAAGLRRKKAVLVRREADTVYAKSTADAFARAFAMYRAAADAGDVEAMVEAGRMCRSGLGTVADRKEAARLLSKAAEAGSVRAMLQLGGMSEETHDYLAALGWYSAARKTGNAEGLYHLGLLYERGLGCERDPVAAENLIRQAAAGGVPGATLWIAALEQQRALQSRQVRPSGRPPPPPIDPDISAN